MDTLNQLRKGRLPWTAENADALWACTGCRQCTGYCDHDNEPGLVLFAGRAQANQHGAGHPKLAGYPERFRNRDERIAQLLRDRIDQEQRSTDAVVGYWPGCDAVDKSCEDVLAAMSLFERIGETHVRVVQGDQVCGGYPLLAAGYPDMFRWHAAKVARTLSPFRTVVVGCSACLYSLRHQYRGEGVELGPRVLSLAEFLAQKVSALPKRDKKERVYFHDPCYLARYCGVIEEPRQVLSRVAEVVDLNWSHEDTECCGGAGLLPKTAPATADSMARRRLRDVAGRGGGAVVTACGTCAFMLKSNAPSGVRVYDLPGYLASVLEAD
jgi:Fe-S oxidoreductase